MTGEAVNKKLVESLTRIGDQITASPRVDDQPRPRELTRADRWLMKVWPRFSAATIDDLSELARRRLGEWFNESDAGPVRGLVLSGEVGSGKTHAAVAIAREVFLLGRTVECWATVELLDALRPDGDETIRRLADIDVLVLDDIGTERPTEWVAERLYSLINRRWLYERPTIVTTNLDLSELQQGLGARAASRLMHDAMRLEVMGVDRRLSVQHG